MHYSLKTLIKQNTINDTDKPKLYTKKIYVKKLSQRALFLKRLEKYIEHIDKIVSIQKITRGFLVRNNIKNRGISCYCRHIVNNETDFLTFDNVDSIPNNNFFSYKDDSGFVWGFNIVTFKELINNEDIKCTNPYNTQKIDNSVIIRFNNLLSVLEKKKSIQIEKAVIIDPFLKMQQRCITIFQKMDSLEQYTQCEWFTDLNLPELKELYKQMLDLWDYRINLSESEKKNFVHSGKLFIENISFINKCTDKIKLSNILLDNFEKLVNEGKTKSDQTTGALWILSGLTLVSMNARDALPWLFQSANVY